MAPKSPLPTLRKSCRSTFLLAGAGLLSLAAGCSRYHPAALPGPPGPPEVLVAEVAQMDVPIYSEWVGTLDGSSNAVIRAQVSGYLEAIRYEEGSFVKKGTLLFEIDPRPYVAAVEQTRSQLEKARAELNRTELEVKRLTPLVKENAVSQQDLDNATLANLANEAQVAAAKAALEEAEIRLGYTKIKAPIDGIAGMATAQIGDLVGSTGPVLTTISAVDPIRAYFPLSEQQYFAAIERIHELEEMPLEERPERLELVLATGRVHPHRGRFGFVERQVDPQTGTIRVVALFSNPGNVLRPGAFVRVRVQTRTKQGALLVPQRAVVELQSTYHLYVVGPENTVEARPVKPGERVGSLWVIDEGLRPGERVIAEGVQKVRPGMVVEPKPFSPREPPGPEPPPQARPPAGG